MKFDVVVMNPPYQSVVDGKKNSHFYRKFVTKARTLSRYVGAIIPASFSNKPVHNIHHHRYLGKCFAGVGIDAGLYVFDEQSTKSAVNAHPIDEQTRKITDHIHTGDFYKPDTGSAYKPSMQNQATNDPDGVMCIWLTDDSGGFAGGLISKEQADLVYGLGEHKVVFQKVTNKGCWGKSKLCSYAGPELGCGSGMYAIFVDSEDQAKNLISYLHSKLVTYIINNTYRCSFAVSRKMFRMIPKVDITRPWTDEELYAHFKLTPEQITYLESQ